MKNVNIHAGTIGQVINAESVEIVQSDVRDSSGHRSTSATSADTNAHSAPASDAGSQETLLARLFVEMFSTEGLYRFLRRTQGPSFVADLPSPGKVPLNHYAAQAAENLIARKLVDRNLLDAWVAERPNRAAEILAVGELSSQ